MAVSTGRRLEARPTELIDRSKTVAFQFEGAAVEAFEGDTVASALYAAGVTLFSRSFKYHRPRGLLCVAGRCPNCLVIVDRVPNVRACTTLVREGMTVRRQNAWPSVDHDLLSVLDRMDRLMPVGFYYKAFHRPKLLWKLAEPVIRRIAGLGPVDIDSDSTARYHHEYKHTDVAVVGGGPAGLSAAVAAADAGARVILIDDQPTLGGHLRLDSRSRGDLPGVQADLVQSVVSNENIEVLTDAKVFGHYQDNLLGILCDRRMVKLRCKRIVMATGANEVPQVFQGNDLPGVMLTTGALRLIDQYGIKPGAVAVVATNNDQAYQYAVDLLEAGVRLAALVDSRSEFRRTLDAADVLKSRGVLILPSHAIARVEGRKQVRAAIVAPLGDGQPIAGERRLDCDLVCVSGGFEPAASLLYQANAGLRFDTDLGETVPVDLPSSLYAAGDITGIHDLDVAVLQGRLAGTEAASTLGKHAPGHEQTLETLRRDLSTAEGRYLSHLQAAVSPVVTGQGRKKFVCFCEDVTEGDVKAAIEEGFSDIQTLKRYTTTSMGPCQGKMCLKAFVGLCAETLGRTIDEIGVTTSRPPAQPVPLGALAGPSHMPIKRTPMDRRHRALGAPMVDLGPWQRAYSYTSPQAECLAVRQRVGIIDVSTLGKLDVKGKDAPALLDRIYTNRFSDLRIGRIRYGVMCTDAGTILDDGTVTRLAEDHYFVTTTTGNVELIEEWFKWWLAGTGMCAHVTNVTSAYAAINVAGPLARDTLVKLTEVDLSREKFRYMRSKQGQVAGVPTIFLRIGFVGETGWELHFPSEYGEYMWDTLIRAGREYDIEPFGLEAQRILRLEKKHIIVNQDTDSVTTPLESDMDWVVKLDKEDFIGRGGLVAASERDQRERLVGFVSQDGLVPHDGDPVVLGRSPVGRVTSARLSPTLGKGFGLAWVPAQLAQEGRQIHIRVNGEVQPATVTLKAFYDPEGVRLRE